MAGGVDPIRRPRTAQLVEERLLRLIREQGLGPGDRMPSERTLMEMYGVGRRAIREAMQGLQRMGLVDIRHGERPRIAEPTLQTLVEQMGTSIRHVLAHSKSSLEHLKQARTTLEAELARIAAAQRGPGDLAALEALLAQQTAAQADPEAFLHLDGAFHSRIAMISGNPIFETVVSSVFAWLRVFHVHLVRRPGLEALTLGEHRAILDAVARGDADGAGEAMRRHLMRANQLYHQPSGQADPG